MIEDYSSAQSDVRLVSETYPILKPKNCEKAFLAQRPALGGDKDWTQGLVLGQLRHSAKPIHWIGLPQCPSTAEFSYLLTRQSTRQAVTGQDDRQASATRAPAQAT